MRFLIFIFAFLFIAAIFFVRDEILSKRVKIVATALIVLLCAGAYFYESASERSAKLEEEMVFKFNAGARLRCGGAINSTSETRGAADSFSEKHSADTKNLGAKAGEANLNAQDKTASAAQENDARNSAVQSSTARTNEQASAVQSSTARTNEQASAAQTSDAVSGEQNSAQSPTSQNSTQQGDMQSLTPQNSMRQEGMRSSASQNSAQRDDAQTYSPQASAQNSKATQNSAQQSLNLQGSAQIVTRENFTYSFSLGAFIAKKSAGAEFKGKTYKIKECVYDQ